jgi:hypothetical protein
MADLEDLARAVRAYERDEWSLDQFADWFRDVSRRKFAEPVEVRKMIFEIDGLFSEMHFAGKAEAEFRQELANAIAPLWQVEIGQIENRSSRLLAVIGKPLVYGGTAIASFPTGKTKDNRAASWSTPSYLPGAMSARLIPVPVAS